MMGRECTILIRRTGRDGPRSPHGEWAETHRDVLLRKPERVRTHQDIWDGTVGTHWDIPQLSSRFLDCLPKAACRRYRTPLFWEFCRSIYFWGFIRNSLLREILFWDPSVVDSVVTDFDPNNSFLLWAEYWYNTAFTLAHEQHFSNRYTAIPLLLYQGMKWFHSCWRNWWKTSDTWRDVWWAQATSEICCVKILECIRKSRWFVIV